MKNLFQRAIMFLAQSEVIAHFLAPSAGAAEGYKDGDYIGQGSGTDRTDNTKGKQVIVAVANNKFMILGFDAESTKAAADRNPHWFAADKNFLEAVPETTDIDFENSDIVYGTGQTVNPIFTIANTIPFKKVGNTIKYDATIAGAVTNPSNVSGLPANVTTVVPTTPAGTTPTATTPTTANTSTGFFANLAWWGYAIIVIVLCGIIYAIYKMAGGGKGKVVKK